MINKSLLISIIAVVTTGLSACSSQDSKEQESTQEVQKNSSQQEEMNSEFYEIYQGKLEHIHGIGYPGNKNKVFFAAHDGLKIYDTGTWYKTKEQNNDYMGFNAVNNGFYTSGHPGEGVNLPNPLGLMYSSDNGKTLEELGLQGQSDFHAMGVGYNNHVIYVLNEHKNSEFGKGIFVTKDNGKSWLEVEASNLGENLFSIAVHPSNEDLVAVAGEKGIFLSKDGGESFSLLTDGEQGTSVFMSEEALWYGTYSGSPKLIKVSLESEEKESIGLPTMDQDAVMYFSQNPSKTSELVFVTFNGNVFLSEDNASSWSQLVDNGIIK